MKAFVSLVVLFFSLAVKAQEFIPIWPAGKKPNSNGKPVKDSFYNERIWQVHTPGMYAFPVPKGENRGTTVLICPGGGYERLSHIYNGFQMAKWFNTKGINAYVLVYRLPHQQDLQQKQLAGLQDAQRAIKYLKANTAALNIDPAKVGVMGVSAGGHLASMLGTSTSDVSKIKDSMDTISPSPAFMVLLSPVISMGEHAHAGSRRNLLGADTSIGMIEKYSTHKQVTSQTPPTFIVHAQNDSTVHVKNSLWFYSALVDKKVDASIHVFPQGGHGIKLFDNPGSIELWPELLDLWLKEKGFVAPLKK